jgi:hypothetical protein
MELTVVHHLKERMLRHWRDESRAALKILPDRNDVPSKTFPGGGGLERRIGGASLLRRPGIERGIEKHGQDGGAPDIQICGRNRTI